MIEVQKVQLTVTEHEQIQEMFRHPGFALMLACAKAQQVAIEADAAGKLCGSVESYWNPKVDEAVKERIVDAARLKIFLSVVDAMQRDGYEFFRVTLSA